MIGIRLFLLLAFLLNGLGPMPLYAQEIVLPKPGVMVRLSPPANAPMLKGIKVHPDQPFQMEFILDQGDKVPAELKEESSKLIKYFLASLTTPEKDMWVNLSPYEKDRIIPASFGLTEMGRDLLAQDYLLKQVTASLIYPEDEVGRKFWKRMYEEAKAKFNTTDIPVNTFNKVWIVPDKAEVFENAKASTAYVQAASLKVMLETDYLSVDKHVVGAGSPGPMVKGGGTPPLRDVNKLGEQIVREIVIPELTKEVNEGSNFAQLRQVYHSLILATWYKKKIKDSILSKVYVDKNKTVGAGLAPARDVRATASVAPTDVERIYQQYLAAFKKGVYNYIKEEPDPSGAMMPRKYFSGGVKWDMAQLSTTTKLTAELPDRAMQVNVRLDQAMTTGPALKETIGAKKVYEFKSPVFAGADSYEPIGSPERRTAFLQSMPTNGEENQILDGLSRFLSVPRLNQLRTVFYHAFPSDVDAVFAEIDAAKPEERPKLIAEALVSVTAYYQPQGNQVVIVISDNGIGIPFDILKRWERDEFASSKPRITEPFDHGYAGGKGLGVKLMWEALADDRTVSMTYETRQAGQPAYRLEMLNYPKMLKVIDKKEAGTDLIITMPAKPGIEKAVADQAMSVQLESTLNKDVEEAVVDGWIQKYERRWTDLLAVLKYISPYLASSAKAKAFFVSVIEQEMGGTAEKYAAEMLIQNKVIEAVEPLLAKFSRSDNSSLQDRLYLRILLLLGDTVNAAKLANAFKSKDDHAQVELIMNLPSDPNVPRLLVLLTKVRDRFVRREVARLLGAYGGRAAQEALIDMLGDKDQKVVINALDSLAAIGDEDTMAVLHEKISLEPAKRVYHIFDDHSTMVAYTKKVSITNRYNDGNLYYVGKDVRPNIFVQAATKAIRKIDQRLKLMRTIVPKIKPSSIKDKKVAEFMQWLKQNDLQDVVIVGGGVRDAYTGRKASDIDISIAVDLAQEERWSYAGTLSQIDEKVYKKVMKGLERLAKALNVSVDDFLSDRPVVWNGIEIQYAGPVKLGTVDQPVYIKRSLVDATSRALYSSSAGASLLQMALDADGNVYGRISALADFDAGYVRIVGNPISLEIGGILRVLRLKHEYGLELYPEDQDLIVKAITKAREQAAAEVVTKPILAKQYQKVLEKAKDKEAARLEMQQLKLTDLLKSWNVADHAMLSDEEGEGILDILNIKDLAMIVDAGQWEAIQPQAAVEQVYEQAIPAYNANDLSVIPAGGILTDADKRNIKSVLVIPYGRLKAIGDNLIRHSLGSSLASFGKPFTMIVHNPTLYADIPEGRFIDYSKIERHIYNGLLNLADLKQDLGIEPDLIVNEDPELSLTGWKDVPYLLEVNQIHGRQSASEADRILSLKQKGKSRGMYRIPGQLNEHLTLQHVYESMGFPKADYHLKLLAAEQIEAKSYLDSLSLRRPQAKFILINPGVGQDLTLKQMMNATISLMDYPSYRFRPRIPTEVDHIAFYRTDKVLINEEEWAQFIRQKLEEDPNIVILVGGSASRDNTFMNRIVKKIVTRFADNDRVVNVFDFIQDRWRVLAAMLNDPRVVMQIGYDSGTVQHLSDKVNRYSVSLFTPSIDPWKWGGPSPVSFSLQKHEGPLNIAQVGAVTSMVLQLYDKNARALIKANAWNEFIALCMQLRAEVAAVPNLFGRERTNARFRISLLRQEMLRLIEDKNLYDFLKEEKWPVFADWSSGKIGIIFEQTNLYKFAIGVLSAGNATDKPSDKALIVYDPVVLDRLEEGSASVERALGPYFYTKTGRSKEIAEAADRMTQRIRQDLGTELSDHKEEWKVIVRRVAGALSSASLIARNVANQLGIEVTFLDTPESLAENNITFAQTSDRTERERLLNMNRYVFDPKEVFAKNVIMIEDTLVSGSNINVISKVYASAGVWSFRSYVLTQLAGKDAAFEGRLNSQARQIRSLQDYADILNASGAVYTTKLVEWVLQMEADEFGRLLGLLNDEAKLNLYFYALRRGKSKVDRLAATLHGLPRTLILSRDILDRASEILIDYNFRIPLSSSQEVISQLTDGAEPASDEPMAVNIEKTLADQRLRLSDSDQAFLKSIHGLIITGKNGKRYQFVYSKEDSLYQKTDKGWVYKPGDTFRINEIDAEGHLVAGRRHIGGLDLFPTEEHYLDEQGRLKLGVLAIKLKADDDQGQGVFSGFLKQLPQETVVKVEEIIHMPTLKSIGDYIADQDLSRFFDEEDTAQLKTMSRWLSSVGQAWKLLEYYYERARRFGELRSLDAALKQSPFGKAMEAGGFHTHRVFFESGHTGGRILSFESRRDNALVAQASIDPLTGTINLPEFEEMLQKAAVLASEDPELGIKLSASIVGGSRYLMSGKRKDIDVMLQYMGGNFELKNISRTFIKHLQVLIDLGVPAEFSNGNGYITISWNSDAGRKSIKLDLILNDRSAQTDVRMLEDIKRILGVIPKASRNLFVSDYRDSAKDMVSAAYYLSDERTWELMRRTFLGSETTEENNLELWKRIHAYFEHLLKDLPAKLKDPAQQETLLAQIRERSAAPLKNMDRALISSYDEFVPETLVPSVITREEFAKYSKIRARLNQIESPVQKLIYGAAGSDLTNILSATGAREVTMVTPIYEADLREKFKRVLQELTDSFERRRRALIDDTEVYVIHKKRQGFADAKHVNTTDKLASTLAYEVLSLGVRPEDVRVSEVSSDGSWYLEFGKVIDGVNSARRFIFVKGNFNEAPELLGRFKGKDYDGYYESAAMGLSYDARQYFPSILPALRSNGILIYDPQHPTQSWSVRNSFDYLGIPHALMPGLPEHNVFIYGKADKTVLWVNPFVSSDIQITAPAGIDKEALGRLSEIVQTHLAQGISIQLKYNGRFMPANSYQLISAAILKDSTVNIAVFGANPFESREIVAQITHVLSPDRAMAAEPLTIEGKTFEFMDFEDPRAARLVGSGINKQTDSVVHAIEVSEAHRALLERVRRLNLNRAAKTIALGPNESGRIFHVTEFIPHSFTAYILGSGNSPVHKDAIANTLALAGDMLILKANGLEHGDLQFQNVLWNEQGQWKYIDIGEKIVFPDVQGLASLLYAAVTGVVLEYDESFKNVGVGIPWKAEFRNQPVEEPIKVNRWMDSRLNTLIWDALSGRKTLEDFTSELRALSDRAMAAGNTFEFITVLDNPLDLHARPSAALAEFADRKKREGVLIRLTYDEARIDAWELMDVFNLNIPNGAQVKIEVTGDLNEEEARAVQKQALLIMEERDGAMTAQVSQEKVIVTTTHDGTLNYLGKNETVLIYDFHDDRTSKAWEAGRAGVPITIDEANWVSAGEAMGKIAKWFLIHPKWQIEGVASRFMPGLGVSSQIIPMEQLKPIEDPVIVTICFDYFLHKGTPALDYNRTLSIIGKREDASEEQLLKEAREIFETLKARGIKVKKVLGAESPKYVPENKIALIEKVVQQAWAEYRDVLQKEDRAMTTTALAPSRAAEFKDLNDFALRYRFRGDLPLQGRSVKDVVDHEMPDIVKTFDDLLAIRAQMDRQGRKDAPLIIWQNLSLGLAYPYIDDDLKKKLNIKVVSEKELKESSGDLRELSRYRFLLVPMKVPSSFEDATHLYDYMFDNKVWKHTVLDRLAKRLNAVVVMIDNSADETSAAQLQVRELLQQDNIRGLVLSNSTVQDGLDLSSGWIFLNNNHRHKASWLDNSPFVHGSSERIVVGGRETKLQDLLLEYLSYRQQEQSMDEAMTAEELTVKNLVKEGYTLKLKPFNDPDHLSYAPQMWAVEVKKNGDVVAQGSEILLALYPNQKVMRIHNFSPDLPYEKVGRGRALLKAILKELQTHLDLKGFHVLTSASGPFQRSLLKMNGFDFIKGPVNLEVSSDGLTDSQKYNLGLSIKFSNIHGVIPDLEQVDEAMAAKGGIDFNADKMNLKTTNADGVIKFNTDPKMLEQLQNASGFVPVILDVKPLTDIPGFLGINKEGSSTQLAMAATQ